MRRLLVLASFLLLSSVARAEESTSYRISDDDGGRTPAVRLVQAEESAEGENEDSGEGTLPPVIVRPPVRPDPTPATPPPLPGDGSFGSGGLGDGGSPDASSPPAPSLFPSLGERMLGGLDSGLRGPQGSLFDNARAADIVTAQQLTEQAPLDIGQALEQTTGVLIQRTGRGQSSPFVRGLTGQQVLLMVDGVRMTNATFRAGPNQYFNTIDPNMVERIEVIRGPGSVLYGGDAIGGVINIVTKRASQEGDFLSAGTVQRFSTADLGYTGRLHAEGWVGALGAYGGAGYGTYNNLDIGGNPDAPAGATFGRQPASSWRYNSADIKLHYQLANCSELVFGYQHYEAQDVFRTDRFPADRESIFDPQQRDLYYLRWQGTNPCGCGLIDTYQLTASFHRFDEDRADRDFRAGRNPLLTSFRGFTDEQTGITGSFTSDMDQWGQLSYGWDWYHDEVDSQRTDVDASNSPATSVNRPGEIPNDAYYSRYGVYLQWDVWLTERLRATSGVRYEHVEAGATVTAGNVTGQIDPEYQDWIGNVGLTYELNPDLHLVGSISEGFRAPNIDDLATLNGNVFVGTQLPNPNLAPETSITYEVGAKLNGELFRGQAFVWWNDLRDFIDRGAPNNMLLLERSNGAARLNGVEADGELLLGCDWSLYGNFWYTYGQNTVANEPLSRIPPMQGIVGLRRRWNQGNDWFSVYGWLVDRQDRLSARDISDVNRIPAGGTPGYATLNLRYGRMIARQQRLSVTLENVLDEQYRVHGSGSDAPGINAVLTYEWLH